ncbi:MAG TPA: protein-disulfide reductase DsbD N-terminal domain-containing protein [Pyrinomonadaceae bacterium]|nr:protein-disulfide reductase DsbD N-terminal domain-containing protein [Pyrinomonadaceae bacterium]
MRNRKQNRLVTLLLLSTLLAFPFSFHAKTLTPVQQPNITVSGYFTGNRAQRGRVIRAAVAIDIPSGYHINSNRPLAKFLIPTSLKIEAPTGARVGPVSFPPAQLRNFSFSQEKLSVYEGHVVLRFNVTVPPNFSGNELNLRAHLRYQSCNDEACFPPVTREFDMSIAVS